MPRQRAAPTGSSWGVIRGRGHRYIAAAEITAIGATGGGE
jgi:hypothetical protein